MVFWCGVGSGVNVNYSGRGTRSEGDAFTNVIVVNTISCRSSNSVVYREGVSGGASAAEGVVEVIISVVLCNTGGRNS